MQTATISRKRILLVDDDTLFSRILDYQLRQSGFSPIPCNSEQEMFSKTASHGIADLFILDYNLGQSARSGLDLCREVKAYFDRPVIMLTADRRVETLLACFSAGADEYIVKPCEQRELAARINVILRLYNPINREISLLPDIALDQEVRLCQESQALIHTDGNMITLARNEIAMIELLVASKGTILDRNKAYWVLFGFQMDPANRSIDLLISRIRKKLGLIGCSLTVKSVRSQGYMLTKSKRSIGNHPNI